MRVKIETVAPDKNTDRKNVSFEGWQPFLGITEEQDFFHSSTYIRFIETRKTEKHIYLSEN